MRFLGEICDFSGVSTVLMPKQIYYHKRATFVHLTGKFKMVLSHCLSSKISSLMTLFITK